MEVELTLHGIDAYCREHLGGFVAEVLFVRQSVAKVYGLRLGDGREVIVKAHRVGVSAPFLEAVQSAQRRLVSRRFPCPRPLAGPTALEGRRLATAEASLTAGSSRDGHDPSVRALMASALADLVAHCRDLAHDPGWGQHPMAREHGGRWPPPHDPRFDLAAPGGEWIDAVADGASQTLERTEVEPVVVHLDWRPEHLRFAGERLVAVYDWESLAAIAEPAAAGANAHAFCMDWSVDEPTDYPTLDEALGFIADYEAARGVSFNRDERVTARAGLTYSLAYTARCEHSDARAAGNTTIPPGSARARLREHL